MGCISIIIISQVSISAAESNGDDMNAGNIPIELSQLSNLNALYLNNNNLSGNELFLFVKCIVRLVQGKFLLNSRCCQGFHISV